MVHECTLYIQCADMVEIEWTKVWHMHKINVRVSVRAGNNHTTAIQLVLNAANSSAYFFYFIFV